MILLSSGHLLKVRGVTLYPAEEIAEIAQLREMALQKLGGVSSGIGFLGSPGWAIGGALVLGMLEGAMSKSSRKDGVKLLRDAAHKALVLLDNGTMFPLSKIQNVDEPSPSLWTAEDKGKQFAIDGGEFVTVDTSTGPMKVRWLHVSSYSIVEESNLPA